ncbi:Flp family type IVb pilin [Leptospira interrogans]
MRKSLDIMAHLRKDEEGAALIEYSVLLGIILAVTVGTFSAISASTNTVFTALSTMLTAV